MLKLEYSPSVTLALIKAFPKYSLQKANSKIEKYLKVLQRLMRRSKLNKNSKLQKRIKTYEFEASILWDKTGQLGSERIRIHQWMLKNRVPLVINTRIKYRPTKDLAIFKTTKLLTIKDESFLNSIRLMTEVEMKKFLDTPTQDDIDEIDDYLNDFRALNVQEQKKLYDSVEVDIESLKSYLKKLANGQIKIATYKQESDADYSEYILRIAQLNNGMLPQLKHYSEFGRNYYKNISVQNVSKRVREVFLGDSWEYDCKSCSASWKMAFAQEYYNSKKRHKQSFDDSFSAMTLYLEYKSVFFDEVIKTTFALLPYSHEFKTKAVKNAMTAIGFGAKLTTGYYKSKDGDIKFSSLYEIFDEKIELLRRFKNSTIVSQYCDEQSILNKYIVNKYINDAVWLAEMEASRFKRESKPYKDTQKISWLFQHAETKMMDIVRDELQKLGKTVLANVHDAIVVRQQLTASELLAIEQIVRTSTNVQYFALGETQYQRHN